MKSVICFALAFAAVLSLRAYSHKEHVNYHEAIGNLALIPQGGANSPWGNAAPNTGLGGSWAGSPTTAPWGNVNANNGNWGAASTNLVNNPLNNLFNRIPGQNNFRPGFQQPGFQQPGFQQPGFQQPGFRQPGFQQPGFQQPGRNNLINNPLNNLWGRLPTGSNVWNPNTMALGMNCPGVRMSVTRGGRKTAYNYEGPVRLTCQLPNGRTYADQCSNQPSCQQLFCKFAACTIQQGGRVLKQRL